MIFITIDITRAIGLELKYPDLKLICLYQSPIIDSLREKGVDVFCIEEQIKKDVKPSSASILSLKEVKEWIESQESNPGILVFKPTAKIEAIIRHNGWKLFNSPAELNRLYEDKISFNEICSQLDIKTPRSIIKQLIAISWKDIHSLGGRTILQLRRGHAGETSFLITSEADLKKIKSELSDNHLVKLSEFITGDTLTVNCEIQDDGLHIGYLMKQIAGIPELNSSKLGTCGVVAQKEGKLPKEMKAGIQKLGKNMQKNGYKGIFGVDIIQTEKDEIFFIECNARFTATMSFHNQLEHRQSFAEASQIIIRNTENEGIIIDHSLKSGIYIIHDGVLKLVKESIHLSDLSSGEFLILIRPSKSSVSSGLEIAYIQALEPLVNYLNQLHEIIQILKNDVKIRIKSSYINPDNFWKNEFGGVNNLTDLLRKPIKNFKNINSRAISRNRQTQLLPNEPSFRLLNQEKDYYLVEKFDGTKGWIPKNLVTRVKNEENIKKMETAEFLKTWENAPYLWGGITKKGTDCSGFVQQFFLQTNGQIIPKHSQDQKKLGQNISQNDLQNSDLVFLQNKKGDSHIGIFYENMIWHACLKFKKVIAQTIQEIQNDYDITEMRRLIVD